MMRLKAGIRSVPAVMKVIYPANSGSEEAYFPVNTRKWLLIRTGAGLA